MGAKTSIASTGIMSRLRTIATIALTISVLISACEIMPRNTLKDCRDQCKGSKKSKACYDFCDCIHKQGQPLDSCLDKYDQAPSDQLKTP